LTNGPHTIGEMLCGCAAKGNVKRLTSLMKAGADLNQPDVSNRTALHLAVHHKQVNDYSMNRRVKSLLIFLTYFLKESCVTFLLKNKVLFDKKDDFGLTPADIARKFEHANILEMLTNH
jgi:ankyrin repeat protein